MAGQPAHLFAPRVLAQPRRTGGLLLLVLVLSLFAMEGRADAYVGGKFQLQEANCSAGGRIYVYPPTKYQVNSWYYGNPSRYSEKVWWQPRLYKYTSSGWTLWSTGAWSYDWANIVGLVPSFYDIYGQGHFWRTGTGGTTFVPFFGLNRGYYAVKQQLYWQRPGRSKYRWTTFYEQRSTTCHFI